MAKLSDIKYIKQAISSASKKLKEKYLDTFNHNYRMYNSQEAPKSKICDSTVEPINLVYPNVELNKVELGFRNPKAIIKNTRRFYFIRKVRGNPEREIVDPKDYQQIFDIMQSQNMWEFTNQEDGETVDYIILDGEKSSKLAEGAINTTIREKNIETQLELVKTDAFVSRAGALWVTYYSPFLLPVQETEYVKTGDICVSREIIGETVFFDGTIKTVDDYSKSKWVSKRFFISKEDVEALEMIKDLEGKSIFKSEAIKKLLDGDIGTVVTLDKAKNEKSSERASDVLDDDRNSGYYFHEVWMRPSLKEQVDPNNKYNRGKMFYVIEDCEEEISEVLPWPNKTDKFPLKMLYFNNCGDSFFPVSDIETYEPLLAEYNVFKALIREAVDLECRVKMIVNSERWINADLPKINQQLADKNTRLIHIPGCTPGADIFQFKINASSQVWGATDSSRNEIARVSLNSDARFGEVVSRASATGYSIGQQALSVRTQSRQYIYANFFIDVIEHMLSLMQQYYTKPKMVQISGGSDASWVEFTREQIQGEYLTSVDVMSMNPSDIIQKTQRAMQLLNIMISIFSNDKVFAKIVSEGKTFSLSAAFKEIYEGLELNNEKIFSDVPVEVSQYAEQYINQLMHMTPQMGQAGVNMQGGRISTNEGAPGAMPKPVGEVAQSGGKPKVPEEEQMPVTQGNAGGGRS